MKNISFVPFSDISLTEGFWLDRYLLNRNVSVDSVCRRFEETGRFDALRFNFLKNGRKPHYFYDSDVAKWMEGIAYLYTRSPEGMEPYIDLCEELIDCMEAAQRPDGYLNSFHQQIEPQNIFKIRDHHELYCAGHLIEAAIAYHRATGRDRFLKIMERYCDCIYRAFIAEKTAEFVTPGHEEIELALIALYRHTGVEKYLEMARFFLVNRGKTDEQYVYSDNRFGTQDDTDIYNLHEANGHSVRALYLYSGIADLALETGDGVLLQNLKDVFADITQRKMYVTGGVGSTCGAESFTVAYDLPNMTAYSESCCAVAMIMFATRMRRLEQRAEYGHTVERVLFNAMLASTSLDGKGFFYENPLEIALEERGRQVSVPAHRREHLAITQRVEVFSCSCCPPNINRFFGGFGGFICLTEDGHATIEQFIASNIKTDLGEIRLTGDYAIDGRVKLASESYGADTLAVRIPQWCTEFDAAGAKFEVKDGYAYFAVGSDFEISLDFHIAPRFVSANPNSRANVGRVALTYGPIVYCLEGVDNGSRLNRIEVDPQAAEKAEAAPDFHGFNSVSLPAFRLADSDRLYFAAEETALEPIKAKFIPYYAAANRGESDMLVWVRRH